MNFATLPKIYEVNQPMFKHSLRSLTPSTSYSSDTGMYLWLKWVSTSSLVLRSLPTSAAIPERIKELKVLCVNSLNAEIKPYTLSFIMWIRKCYHTSNNIDASMKTHFSPTFFYMNTSTGNYINVLKYLLRTRLWRMFKYYMTFDVVTPKDLHSNTLYI